MHRGQSAASRRTTRAVRGVLRHDRRLAERAEPPQHRDLPEHDRGAQRGDVHAADRVPRRRQRGDHADGAQLQLRALVRAVPRDPAPVRPPRGVPGRAVRPRPPGELDLDHLAELVDDRTKLVCCTGASNFLGTKPPLDGVRRIARRSGYLQPDGERRVAAAGRRRAARARARRWTSRRSTSTTCRSRSTRCSRRSASASCTAKEHLLAQARPFLYGGDMIAEGQVSPDHVGVQRPALEVRRRHPEHPRRDRLGAGPAADARPRRLTGRP